MLTFNELTITPDGKQLIINASVDDKEYYEDVFIDKILVDTLYSEGLSNKAKVVFLRTGVENTNPVVYDRLDIVDCSDPEDTKYVKIVISANSLGIDLNKNIVFVLIVSNGEAALDSPCVSDTLTLAVVNFTTFYKDSLSYIKELADTCQVPRNFIDCILRYKALELSIKAGQLELALKYWKKFFKDGIVKLSNNCNCNGHS